MVSSLRIGVDIDGVLANFNHGYQRLLNQLSGPCTTEDFEKVDPICWGWPKHYGWTPKQDNAGWEAIKSSPTFWASLHPYPFVENYLGELAQAKIAGHDIYFITTRPGNSAKLQSEYWLTANHFPMPTVLIAANHYAKGQLATGLDLTHFIDDKPENCYAVKGALGESCKVYLLSRRYNEAFHDEARLIGISIIGSVTKFLEEVYEDAQSPIGA